MLCEYQTSVNSNKQTKESTTNDISSVHSVKSISAGGNHVHLTQVLLQVARIPVCLPGGRGTTNAVVLFDTGADRTYVSQAFVEPVKREWVGSQHLSQAVFGSETATGSQVRNLYKLWLQGQRDRSSIVAVGVPLICTPLVRPSVSSDVLKDLGVQVLEVFSGEQVHTDLLVGMDFYWSMMSGDTVRGSGLVAQRSIFGWILSGSVASHEQMSHQLLCNTCCSDFSNFWNL